MTIRRATVIGIVVLLAVLLLACAPPAVQPPQAGDAALAESKWVLTEMTDRTLIAGTTITMRFEDTTLSGSAGCNTYGASYAATKGSLQISDLYWTEMGCMEPEGILEQELAYLNALNTVAGYQMESGRLFLLDEGGKQVLEFDAEGAASSSPAAGSTEDGGLTAALKLVRTLSSGEAVDVRFTLTNASSKGIYVLNWFTPLEGLAGDIFQVERDGAAIPYRGKLVKRAEPTSDDYVWLDAGESVSVEIDIAEGYDFTQAGEYTVQFRSPRISHIAATTAEQAVSMDRLGPVDIPSEPVSLVME